MKIAQTIGIAFAFLLAAGCAHEERNYGSYSGPGEYNTQNNFSSPPGGGRIIQSSPSQSDNSIVAQVRESLQRDPEIAFVVPNIQITAANGAIILNGSVQSEEQKRQIMAKVLQVNGVVAVNNQLSVMSGPNGAQGSGSQLNPTGASDSERLYKDAANGQDNSTNNALNLISHDDRADQLYRESNQGGNNNSSNDLNPTSRDNGSTQIYQGNPGEKPQDQNSNTNNNLQMP